jgi:DNA-binding ferritin-like protein
MALSLKADTAPKNYTVQTAYTELHKLFLQVKLSHYTTKSYAAHSALGKTYDDMNDLIDTITEKLIGYSGEDPQALGIGSVLSMEPTQLAIAIMGAAERLEDFAEANEYCDIENLAQELSGIGAQLKYLSRFK